MRRARRAWLEHVLQDWEDDDLSALANLLARFAEDLERDLDDAVTELTTAPADPTELSEAASAEHRRSGDRRHAHDGDGPGRASIRPSWPRHSPRSPAIHGLNHLSWVVTAYLLTTCISTPLWGKLDNLYGRKALFQLAIVIFLVGSVLSGLSQSMAELIAFRAIQGIRAGGLMVG